MKNKKDINEHEAADCAKCEGRFICPDFHGEEHLNETYENGLEQTADSYIDYFMKSWEDDVRLLNNIKSDCIDFVISDNLKLNINVSSDLISKLSEKILIFSDSIKNLRLKKEERDLYLEMIQAATTAQAFLAYNIAFQNKSRELLSQSLVEEQENQRLFNVAQEMPYNKKPN